ncbi:MAG: hypothetical protein [phage Lak_Megaphage_RVC_AP3_GC31]|nr:MAG: hypothetical protein [phage Lak_Megaphage_RVC_AP3_GC31]
MVKQSQSPQRILKSILNPDERRQFLSSLPDNLFVAEDLEQSIDQWLDIQDDKDYVQQFYNVRDKIREYTSINTFQLQQPVFIQRDKHTNRIIFKESLSQFMTPENKRNYIDMLLMNMCPGNSEYILHTIFKEQDGFIIEHEPNGRNECPDLKVTWPDKTVSYIEVKSVLCSFFDDGTFKGKVNNAMKGIDQILNDMRQQETKDNKCGTNLRNITTVFFFYFNNPDTEEAEYFRTYVLPAPLAIDCEFNKDGTFKKLGQKSDTNFNTVLNLKIRSPYNKYNTLADRAMLIATGYTMNGRQSLISNAEGDYISKKELFEYYKQQIEYALNIDKPTSLLFDFEQLKANKFNKGPYATKEDKEYIKSTIKDFKIRINKQYGKGTVR